ncbi:MAG TPA: hypothetical protein VFS67_33160 [Polyangiaceae bacterium]|nr:hypothetical protein [Polyangiaceae bacterium]
MKTKLEVSVPGEADRHFPVDTRAVIGKGPTADISLDVPGVIAQHFRVKLGANDVDVRLAPGARPLTYEGRPFSGGAIPYGADFYLERVRFSCVKPKPESNSKLLPLLLACVVVVGGVFALLLSNQSELEGSAEANEQEVVLFPEAPPCPQTDAAGAARRAFALEKAAETKRERYRYAAHDGLDAGRLYAQASQCYLAAGDAAGKQRVDQAGDAWRQQITEEFRAARLRLRTTLQDKDLNGALNAISSMQRMLQGETLPYATYLATTERQIQLELYRIRKGAEKFF